MRLSDRMIEAVLRGRTPQSVVELAQTRVVSKRGAKETTFLPDVTTVGGVTTVSADGVQLLKFDDTKIILSLSPKIWGGPDPFSFGGGASHLVNAIADEYNLDFEVGHLPDKVYISFPVWRGRGLEPTSKGFRFGGFVKLDRESKEIMPLSTFRKTVEFVQHQTALDKFNKENPDPAKSRTMKKAHRDHKSNYDKGQRQGKWSADRKRATRELARHNERPRTPSTW